MKRVLDYGCGRGFREPVLGRRGEYFGVDISPENIAAAEKDFPGGRFTLISGELPFPDGYFDEVFAYDVLEHVLELEPVLAELARCLKPGGRLLIEVPSVASEKWLTRLNPDYWRSVGHRRFVTPALIGELAEKFGFSLAASGRKKGIDNLILSYYFISGRRILGQTGEFERENLFLRRAALLFTEDFFESRLYRQLRFFWWVCPVWLATWPLGRLLSLVWPKSISYTLEKL